MTEKNSLLVIRQLKQNDWQAWKNIRLRALKEEPQSFYSSYEEEILQNDEKFKNDLAAHDIFGAWLEDELVGCAGFFVHNLLKAKHKGSLYSMFVSKDVRGKKIGEKILKAIIDHAKTKVLQLHLMVVVSNEAAIKLYLKYGFKIYGTEPKGIQINNVFYDEYLMFLDLTNDAQLK